MNTKIKLCSRCKVNPVSETAKRSSYCKSCSAIISKEWRTTNHDRFVEQRKKMRLKPKYKEYIEKYKYKRRENKDRINYKNRQYSRRIRTQVINQYGGKCECCKESRLEFLNIDHIGGGGNKHIKSISGWIYNWLIKNNYPEGFRVLCWNCNMSIGHYGYCPHNVNQVEKKE